MGTRSIRFLLATAATVLLAASACTPGDTGTTPSPPDGEEGRAQVPARQAGDDTVVIAWTGDLNSLDPPDSLVEWNRETSLALYDTLLRYKLEEEPDGSYVWDGLEVAEGLAERWEVDGATVTFHLRQGVTFNETGNPLTAEDVKYSFVRAPEVPGFGRFNSNLAGIFEPDRQIEVVDDYTIRFTFELLDGMPHLLTASLPSLRFPIFGIVDSEEVKAHATEEDPWGHEWLRENPAGSGPYRLEPSRNTGRALLTSTEWCSECSIARPTS
jgi:peptide/nickel transport system substrate-binding protein